MISEKQLCEAARRTEKTLLASLPEPEDCKAVFSPGFLQKMKRLVRRTDHHFRRWARRAAAGVLLALLLGGCGVLAFCPQARCLLAEWAGDVRENGLFPKAEERNAVQDVLFRPAWLPDGFVEMTRVLSGAQTCIIYEDMEKNSIMLVSAVGRTPFSIEQDGLEHQPARVGHFDAELYLDRQSGHANSLVWTDDETGRSFWLYGGCSGGDLLRIAESIRPETENQK